MKVEDVPEPILQLTVELLLAGQRTCERVDFVDRELPGERRDAVHGIALEEIEAPPESGQGFPQRRDRFPKEPIVPRSILVRWQDEDSGHLTRCRRGPQRRLVVHPQV